MFAELIRGKHVLETSGLSALGTDGCDTLIVKFIWSILCLMW
jgi:hypothetical protein